MFARRFQAVAVALAMAGAARADDPASRGAPTVPATRPDLKKALEDSKRNVPRLPLPPLSPEQEAQAKRPADASAKGGGLGPGIVNNGRMRQFYLPKEVTGGGFVREPDPAMTLGYPFQTTLFWIVSRE